MLKNFDLGAFSKDFKLYTELRLQENFELTIVMQNGDISHNATNVTNGISARSYKNGFWGFASNADFKNEAISKVIQTANGNALTLDSIAKAKEYLPLAIAAPNSYSCDFSTKKTRKTQKDYINFMRDLDTYITQNCKLLKSRGINLGFLDMEKLLFTSENSRSYSLVPRTSLRFMFTVDKNGMPITLMDGIAGIGNFEDLFDSGLNEIKKTIDNLYKNILSKKDGVFPESGVKECILDSRVTGILAHEAIGHTTEGDLVKAGSIAKDFLNKQVASPLINLVDIANTYNNKICPQPVFIDDEGTKATDAVIIDKGILRGYMLNKETASFFKMSPTGNARAYMFSDEPLIRMRNTVILPGNDNLEDMISSIGDGYYFMQTSNGQADATSEFMFGISMGYEIKNGKLGKSILDTTISGIAYDVLKSVTMVSKEFSWECAGMCGKKQLIPVGMGGPSLKCKIRIGGK